VTILEAGSATLEIANPAQVRMIDGIEAEGRPRAHLRATADLVEAGADLVAAPRETPWRSLSSRLHGPAGLEITLFEELGPEQAEG
jgi:hypothetical protein